MKWVIIVVSFVHGLIHLMGFVDGTGIKKMPQFTGETLMTLSPTAKTILSYAWLVAFVAFMVAIFGLIVDKDWWRVVAVVAMILSQLLIIIWWKDAWAGTIANLIVLAAVLFYRTSN